MSISKDTLIEAFRVFKTEMQNELLGTIVEALQAAGSSAATETEEIYTATGLAISFSPNTVSVQQGDTATVTVTVTSSNDGTYTLALVNPPNWVTLAGNVITVAPSSTGNYSVTVQATGAETVSETLPVTVYSGN